MGQHVVSAARRVVSRRGAVRGVACGGVARCVAGVARCTRCAAGRGMACDSMVQCVVCGRLTWGGMAWVHRAASSCVVLRRGARATSSLYGMLRRGAPCHVTVMCRATVGRVAVACRPVLHRLGVALQRGAACRILVPCCAAARCCVLCRCPASCCSVAWRIACVLCRSALCHATECCGVSCYSTVARLVSPSCVAVASRRVSRLAVASHLTCRVAAQCCRPTCRRHAAAHITQ